MTKNKGHENFNMFTWIRHLNNNILKNPIVHNVHVHIVHRVLNVGNVHNTHNSHYVLNIHTGCNVHNVHNVHNVPDFLNFTKKSDYGANPATRFKQLWPVPGPGAK